MAVQLCLAAFPRPSLLFFPSSGEGTPFQEPQTGGSVFLCGRVERTSLTSLLWGLGQPQPAPTIVTSRTEGRCFPSPPEIGGMPKTSELPSGDPGGKGTRGPEHHRWSVPERPFATNIKRFTNSWSQPAPIIVLWPIRHAEPEWCTNICFKKAVSTPKHEPVASISEPQTPNNTIRNHKSRCSLGYVDGAVAWRRTRKTWS